MRFDAEIHASGGVLTTKEAGGGGQKKNHTVEVIQFPYFNYMTEPLNMLGICGHRLSCHQSIHYLLLCCMDTAGHRGDDRSTAAHTTSNILRVQWAWKYINNYPEILHVRT